jgi:hypothetical protein
VSIDGDYSSKMFDTDPHVVPGDLYTIVLTRPRVTCRRYTECNTSVVLMVHILYQIAVTKSSRSVSHTMRCLGEAMHVNLQQRALCSARAIRAIHNTVLFMMDSRVVADDSPYSKWKSHLTVPGQPSVPTFWSTADY